MPRRDYRFCRSCKRDRAVVGLLSHTRLCGDCARGILIDNIDGLHFHRGQALQRWRLGMARSIGATLDDAQRAA